MLMELWQLSLPFPPTPIIKIKGKMPSQKIETGQDTVHDVAMDFYGKRIATASSDSTIKIVGVSNNTHQHLATLTGHQGPEGNQNEWSQAHEFDEHKSSVNSIAWAPLELGLCLACGSSDGNVSVFTSRADGGWDVSRIDQAHPVGVTSVSWDPSTEPGALVGSGLLDPVKKLCSGGCDNTVKVWKLYNGIWKMDCFPALQMHTDWVRDVAWAPNLGLPKSTIASASQDGKVNYMDDGQGRGSMGSFMSELDIQIPTAFDPFADANAEDSGVGGKDFMSELDIQIPTAFDPFADANAEDSGVGGKEYVHIRIQQRNGRKA
ncbi:Protein transport protein SEC13-like protein B [Hibiscus syriacus]|uniref:Protein transport protein SEC13-like protein B n=1 Tax=Hibiscus syriacus TaxID=106335 RepID=A0A6A2XV66_HIBSY|nr:Protein transport protein SEC13-like protein B [Hibiscus syriacus]